MLRPAVLLALLGSALMGCAPLVEDSGDGRLAGARASWNVEEDTGLEEEWAPAGDTGDPGIDSEHEHPRDPLSAPAPPHGLR